MTSKVSLVTAAIKLILAFEKNTFYAVQCPHIVTYYLSRHALTHFVLAAACLYRSTMIIIDDLLAFIIKPGNSDVFAFQIIVV